MLFADLSRQIFPDRVVNRVVYDLDELTKNTPPITPNVSAVNLLPSPLCSSSSSTNRIVPVLRKSQSAPKLSLLRGASYGYVHLPYSMSTIEIPHLIKILLKRALYSKLVGQCRVFFFTVRYMENISEPLTYVFLSEILKRI